MRLPTVAVILVTAGVAACSDAKPRPAAAAPDAGEPPPLPHQSFTLESAKLGETRRINLYTPPGYGGAGDARYPVLFMPDGGVEEDFPHVTRTIDTAIRAGEMRPVIVVGIENTERRRDMTGPTEVASDREIAPRVGGSAAFRAFIREELMPAIDARVRGDGHTGIIGESLAGLFVVETFLLEPELFDLYIALSPSMWWNAQALVKDAGQRLGARPELAVTFYLAHAGDDDRDGATSALAAELARHAPKTLTWSYEPWPAEKHSTIYRGASPAVLRKLYPPAGR